MQDAAFAALENTLRGHPGESTLPMRLRQHIITRITDEGLVIEIFDLEGARLFAPGSDQPAAILHDLIALIASVSGLVENGIAVAGHTRSQPVMARVNTVWDLATARANKVRRMLISAGTDAARLKRLTGEADRDHAAKNPMALRNNRIEITLLRTEA